MTPLDYYEKIAEEYDDETKSPVMLAEDIVLFDHLLSEGLLKGSILDAGCGTGLFLDQCFYPKWPISQYRGYDISRAMLKKLGAKWPSFRESVEEMSFLEDHSKFRDTFDVVLSLYAGLNCLSRKEMAYAFQNLWSCVKKGGTLFLMTYGSLKPEERETSLHSILEEHAGYPYTMVEGTVLYEWMKFLPESGDVTVTPFSQPLREQDHLPESGDDNLQSIQYHRTRIERDLLDRISEDGKKGGPSPKVKCSFYLCQVNKI